MCAGPHMTVCWMFSFELATHLVHLFEVLFEFPCLLKCVRSSEPVCILLCVWVGVGVLCVCVVGGWVWGVLCVCVCVCGWVGVGVGVCGCTVCVSGCECTVCGYFCESGLHKRLPVEVSCLSTLPLPSSGMLCGSCVNGTSVSALLDNCVTCGDENSVVIVVLSEFGT